MPVYFCKNCNNMLMLEVNDANDLLLKCETCPFSGNVDYFCRTIYERKEEDKNPDNFVVDIKEQRKLIPSTTENCPKCNHPRAFYHQMQTRSADEPMTIFYRCCDPKCNYSWKD